MQLWIVETYRLGREMVDGGRRGDLVGGGELGQRFPGPRASGRIKSGAATVIAISQRYTLTRTRFNERLQNKDGFQCTGLIQILSAESRRRCELLKGVYFSKYF